MKNRSICVVLFLLNGFLVLAQEKWSRVKIDGRVADAQALRAFVQETLQADHYHFEGDHYVVEIGSKELASLKASPYRYEIIVADIADHFKRTSTISKFFLGDGQAARTGFKNDCQKIATLIPTPAAFTPGSMGGYYTYDEMRVKMGALANDYSSIVDTFSIGKSVEGRDIWCVKISDNVLTDEPEAEVMFNGLQHAREAISGTALIFFLQYLAENYATDDRVRQLINNREIFIIPCVNPDGYVYNQTTNPGGGGGWRKNRRPLGGGEFGVDLNRNYNADWGNCRAPVGGNAGSCGSGSPTSDNETYWGPRPFSEPETRAIRDFTAARNFRVSIDQHAHGMYNTLPHGRTSLHPHHQLLDSQFLYGFASAAMATYNCHRLGNNLQTLNYEVAGGNKDWMFQGDTSMATNKRKVYSFTSEAGTSFWPSAGQIVPLSRGLSFQYLQAALSAGNYVQVQDVSDAAIMSRTGSFSFALRRVGVTDGPVTVTLVPLQNIVTAGLPALINVGTLPQYYSTASGTINYELPAGLSNGQLVKFIWRVDAGGIVSDDTVTKIFNPLTLLYDDMETGTAATRWQISSGWNYTVAGRGLNGTGKSLTESPSGNYPADITCTATWGRSIDLSDATAAYLNFWVRHRSENCRDILRIRISTDGGANYTNLCGALTISENMGALQGEPALTGIREEWSREQINLRDYIGAGMNNVRIQFQFSSNADAGGDVYYKKTDEGFLLDNVQLIKSTATFVVLPVAINRFDAVLLPERSVRLDWFGHAHEQHSHFEVERSIGNNGYVFLGKVDAQQGPWHFIDPHPGPGINQYRLKQVSRSGSFSYSSIVTVYVSGNASFSYQLYPNPAHDVVKLRIQNVGRGRIHIVLTDLSGKQLQQQYSTSVDGITNLDVSLSHLSGSVGILSVYDSKGELLLREKILKYR